MSFHTEKVIEDVQTGEVKVGGPGSIIAATAIGSCIAFVLFDPDACVGGIAHIMLPGETASFSEEEPFRYAVNGFSELLSRMDAAGAHRPGVKACLIGGANVLMDPDDMICRENMDAVENLCREHAVTVAARSMGGFQRRRVMLDLAKRQVVCGIGNESDSVLCLF